MDASAIEKLAHLARLEISAATVEETATSITEVLALVDELQAADTGNTTPMAHPLDAKQRLREDVVSESDVREVFQAIAPATADGVYLVPKVID